MNFTKGDILTGESNSFEEAYHPIIFLRDKNDDFFIGSFISHSKKHGNVILLSSHFNFLKNDDERTSYFAPFQLLKTKEWGPFTKIGELSADGIDYVESKLSDDAPFSFD